MGHGPWNSLACGIFSLTRLSFPGEFSNTRRQGEGPLENNCHGLRYGAPFTALHGLRTLSLEGFLASPVATTVEAALFRSLCQWVLLTSLSVQ